VWSVQRLLCRGVEDLCAAVSRCRMSASFLRAAAARSADSVRRRSAVFLAAIPDEATFTGGTSSNDTVEYGLHLVELIDTDVVSWFNGLWDASRGRALNSGGHVTSGIQYIHETLGRHCGDSLCESQFDPGLLELGAVCGTSRLDDLCRFEEMPTINGIPPQPLSSIDQLGAWLKEHMYCEGDVVVGPEGLYWSHTVEFDSAFAFLDLGHSEADLRARLRLFNDHVQVAGGGSAILLRRAMFRAPADLDAGQAVGPNLAAQVPFAQAGSSGAAAGSGGGLAL